MFFMIVLSIIIVALLILSVKKIYHFYKLRKQAKERLKVFRPPLNWSKESGFNRAPTLAEAELFAVDETGDLIRHNMAQGDNLDEAIEADIPKRYPN